MLKTTLTIFALLSLFASTFAQNMITNPDTVITGTIKPAELNQYQWYADAFRNYSPAPAKIASIKKLKSKTMQIIIFAGSWCEDTQKHLPAFMKALTDAGWPMDDVRIYFLDRDKNYPTFLQPDYGISLIPTFILLEKGEERGRITEYFSMNAESDLNLLLAVK